MSLYRRENSKVWWVNVQTKGRRIRISIETKNKKLAEKIEAKIITDIQEGRWFEKQKAQSISKKLQSIQPELQR